MPCGGAGGREGRGGGWAGRPRAAPRPPRAPPRPGRAGGRAEASEAKGRVLAETLQRSLLPPAVPAVPGLDVAGVYRPAGQGDEVGGDFYDVFEARSGDWAIVVGDVRGKGAEAAVVT